jgi:hypothetical protein
MEVEMTSRYGDPTGLEILGGLVAALFKVAFILGLGFAVDAFLGQFLGEVMSSFGIDTGFWTQYGLIVIPEAVIAGGVLSGMIAACFRK